MDATQNASHGLPEMSQPVLGQREETEEELRKQRARVNAKRWRDKNLERVRREARAYYWNNHEAQRTRSKNYRLANLDKVREKNRLRMNANYQRDRLKILARDKIYRKNNREAYRARKRLRYQQHRKEILAAAKLYRTQNLEQINIRQRNHYKNNREKIINHHRIKNLEKKYQLTENEYETLFQKQKGLCASCGEPPRKKRLAVDHDHQTGQIRQLLCRACNCALGLLKDSPEKIEMLAAYLKRHAQLKLPSP